MYLAKDFYFEAAHKLIGYQGKCRDLHGHSYKLTVIIKGTVKEDGMVMDFGEIKKVVNDKIISIFDHAYINDFLNQPTAENMLVFIWEKLEEFLPLYELRLWETRDSFAFYRGKEANESH